MTLEELKERVELLVHGWEELSGQVEQLKRERDEAIAILQMTMNASKRMVELIDRIDEGQDE